MDFNTLIEIIEEAGYTPYSYSGRGMYGDRCVGFTVDKDIGIFRAIANLIRESIFLDNCSNGEHYRSDQLLTAIELGNVKTDNMGLDTVVYFPRVTWEGE